MKAIIIDVKPITEVDTAHVEALTQLPLSEKYKQFLLKYNGGIPQIDGRLCSVDIPLADGERVASFLINIISIDEVMEQWQYRSYLAEFAEHFDLSSDYVETDRLFPIATLASGVAYITCGGRHDGKIYTADNGDFGILYHSATMEEFLAALY